MLVKTHERGKMQMNDGLKNVDRMVLYVVGRGDHESPVRWGMYSTKEKARKRLRQVYEAYKTNLTKDILESPETYDDPTYDEWDDATKQNMIEIDKRRKIDKIGKLKLFDKYQALEGDKFPYLAYITLEEDGSSLTLEKQLEQTFWYTIYEEEIDDLEEIDKEEFWF